MRANLKLQVARESTTIIEAVNKFVKEGISALPIVDESGKLINIYCKFDVINLVATKTYTDLEVTLREATEHKLNYFDGVRTCKGRRGGNSDKTHLISEIFS